MSRSHWLLITILLVAAILRLGWPGIAEFKFDEANVSRLALALVHQGRWPTDVPSSIPPIPQPALIAYLLAIPFTLTRNPTLAIAFLGTLSTLSVYLTYRLGSRYFDERVGLIAAALYAISPWAIFYSRKLWAETVPLFTVILMLSLFDLVASRRVRATTSALIALAVLINLHLGDLVLALVFLLALAIHPATLRLPTLPKWTALGLLGALIVTLPYLAALLSALPTLTAAPPSPAAGRLDPLAHLSIAAHIATGYQFHALAGDGFPRFYASLPLPDLSILDRIEMVLIGLGFLYVPFRAVSFRPSPDAAPQQSRAPYTLLALWIVLPLLIWTASGLEPLPHRYIMLYPAQYLAVAILLVEASDTLSARRPTLKPLLIGLIAAWMAALALWQLTTYLGMLRFASREGILGGSRLLCEYWGTAHLVRQLARPDHLPIVVHTTGDNPEQDGDAAIWDALLGDLDTCLVGSDSMEVYPDRQYIRLATHADGAFSIQIQSPPPPTNQTAIARLANGVDLLAIAPSQSTLRDLLTPDSRLRLTLTWQIWSLPPTADEYSFTVQLFTVDGLRWGQVDRHFPRRTCWQPGYTLTTSIGLPIAPDAPPDGRYHLLVAMYIYLSDTQQLGVDLLDAAGNPAGQFIFIPLE